MAVPSAPMTGDAEAARQPNFGNRTPHVAGDGRGVAGDARDGDVDLADREADAGLVGAIVRDIIFGWLAGEDRGAGFDFQQRGADRHL